jgi:superfamily II DNA helicase RecQ
MAYFGDTGPPSAEVCCDNHREMRVDTLPKATTAEEWFPLIVLETARSLPYPVGRHRLSQIVTGSKAKVMQEQKYNQHKFYGKLSQLSQPQALSLIDNLLNEGYLQLSRGELPILEVSESGLQALEHRAALPIQVQGGVGQLPQGKVGADFKEDKGASGSTGMVVGDVVGDAKSIEATILETVSKLNGVLGRTGLAKFLTGSKAKWLEEFKTHSGYGQLSYLTQKAAIEVIDNLITAGQLRTTSSLRPKVKLVDELGGEEQNPSPATQLEVEAPTSTPSESVKPETEESKKAVPQPSQKWPEEQLEGAILQVVTDLAGLVSLQSVARLLTAKPNSIVPFSDHPLSGQFQNVSQKELEGLIKRMMLQEKIKSSPKGKLYK